MKMLGIEEKVERLFTKGKHINWDDICNNYALSEEFMRRYKDYINWNVVSWAQYPFSENFIREFKDKLSWIHICTEQSLSLNFIEEMIYYVHWNALSRYQKLSEEFIEKYSMFVNWNNIFKHQKLSDEFLLRHENKMTFSTYLAISDRMDKIDIITKRRFRGYV